METKIFSLLFLFTIISLKGQNGLQIGLGVLTTAGVAKTIDTEYSESIYVSNQYGISLNTDYSFSNKFRIKSGLEYQFQNVSVNKIFNFRAEYFSIPVIFNYNLPKIDKYGLTLGLDAGFSLEKLLGYRDYFMFSSQNNADILNMEVNMETNKSFPYKAFGFSSILFRFGLNIKKDMGNHGHLNFYIHSSLPARTNFGMDINIKKESIIDNVVFPNIEYEKSVNLKRNNIQFGLYYTFGTLTFK